MIHRTKSNQFISVYKDDDFMEKGWAFNISTDEKQTNVTNCGHTYDHEYDPAFRFAYSLTT